VSYFLSQTLERTIADVILNFLASVIVADGFDAYPWVVNVFNIFCEHYFYREVDRKFLKCIAPRRDRLFLVNWVAGARRSVAASVLAWKAGVFARLHPGLKAALLQAASIATDSPNESLQQFDREALRTLYLQTVFGPQFLTTTIDG
jgi:hypothetical protein